MKKNKLTTLAALIVATATLTVTSSNALTSAQIQEVKKAVLSVLFAGGLLGVFFFTHLLPFTFPVQREKIAALKADFEKKQTDLARARATVADLPRFEAEYEQLHERWAMAAELLPADRQMAVLLRKITLNVPRLKSGESPGGPRGQG